MDSLHQPETQHKQRHGCVTAWLIVMIAVYTISIGYNLMMGFVIVSPAENAHPQWIFLLLGFICVLNIMFAVFLFKWKKWAFWGFLITSCVTIGINIYTGEAIVRSLVALFGVGILYAILQIKEDRKSGWENLD